MMLPRKTHCNTLSAVLMCISSQGLWASVAILAVLILIIRLLHVFHQQLRLLITIPLTRGQHIYWAQDSSIWTKAKKHLLQAPLLRSRHHKEIQLSRAISVGTLPSRLHTILLVGYMISNVVYCSLLDYRGKPRAALVAELRGRAGHLAVVNMLPLVLFAARNNPLISVLGVSFDTFNLFHRWIGRIIVLESIVHITAWFVNGHNALGYYGIMKVLMTDTFVQCGLTAAIALLIILIQSPSPIRHAFYEVFLHTHQVLAAVSLGAIAAHVQYHNLPQKPVIYTIIGIWALERGLRLLRLVYYNVSIRGVSEAHIQALNGGACRVTFYVRRPFDETPGRHIYAYIPRISFWMSHPFSVANVNSNTMYQDSLTTKTSPSSIFENLEATSKHPSRTSAYSVSCLMAARTGMTAKLYRKAQASPNGLFICRALIEGPYGASETLNSYGTVLLFAGGVGITNQLSHMRHLICGWAAGNCATQKLVLIWSVRSLEQLYWARPWLQELARMPRYGRELNIVLYVTQLRREPPFSEDQSTEALAEMKVRGGRPNINKLVDKHFGERVGALSIGVCGPGALADDVRKAARRVMIKGKVDFWEEAFTW